MEQVKRADTGLDAGSHPPQEGRVTVKVFGGAQAARALLAGHTGMGPGSSTCPVAQHGS